MFRPEIDIFNPIAAVLHRFLQERAKSLAELGEIDSILRPLRPCYPWLDLLEIQFQVDAVIDSTLAWHAKHLLRANNSPIRDRLGNIQWSRRTPATCCRWSRDPVPARTPPLRHKTRRISRL